MEGKKVNLQGQKLDKIIRSVIFNSALERDFERKLENSHTFGLIESYIPDENVWMNLVSCCQIKGRLKVGLKKISRKKDHPVFSVYLSKSVTLFVELVHRTQSHVTWIIGQLTTLFIWYYFTVFYCNHFPLTPNDSNIWQHRFTVLSKNSKDGAMFKAQTFNSITSPLVFIYRKGFQQSNILKYIFTSHVGVNIRILWLFIRALILQQDYRDKSIKFWMSACVICLTVVGI